MFRWDDCFEGHMLLGFIFSTISFVCLLLTTFSTPFIKTIYFLSVSSYSNSDLSTKFGTFGYCTTQEQGKGEGASECSSKKVGYTQPAGIGDGDELIEWLIKTGILFGIALLLMFVAIILLILSLLRAGKFMRTPIYFRTAALLGTLLAIFAEAFALVLWVHARHAFDDDIWEAKYGAALWTGLVGTIFASLAAAIGGPAYRGRLMYRAHREVPYHL
ncbi:hypothetical protein IAS59_004535 [Cryptococcus gattii]